MSGVKNSSRIITFCVCLAFVGSFLIFLVTCVSFRQTMIPGGPGECISVAFFEKQKMRTVDKVILRAYVAHVGIEEKSVTVTDEDLIREITKEVTVATHTDIKVTPMGCIDLYSKDVLIRSMVWNKAGKDVAVYEEDRTHWIITPNIFGYRGAKERNDDVGIVVLSDGLAEKLDALLEEA